MQLVTVFMYDCLNTSEFSIENKSIMFVMNNREPCVRRQFKLKFTLVAQTNIKYVFLKDVNVDTEQVAIFTCEDYLGPPMKCQTNIQRVQAKTAEFFVEGEDEEYDRDQGEPMPMDVVIRRQEEAQRKKELQEQMEKAASERNITQNPEQQPLGMNEEDANDFFKQQNQDEMTLDEEQQQLQLEMQKQFKNQQQMEEELRKQRELQFQQEAQRLQELENERLKQVAEEQEKLRQIELQKQAELQAQEMQRQKQIQEQQAIETQKQQQIEQERLQQIEREALLQKQIEEQKQKELEKQIHKQQEEERLRQQKEEALRLKELKKEEKIQRELEERNKKFEENKYKIHRKTNFALVFAPVLLTNMFVLVTLVKCRYRSYKEAGKRYIVKK
ncbi:titin-like [Hexamita inflata]|uniref:Titin-like n=1 Tax=Hexamita inflata TaxID=28002 RepID=A0AA86UMC3_9EUKA|nr:titin-like [Hexamita inflata]